MRNVEVQNEVQKTLCNCTSVPPRTFNYTFRSILLNTTDDD